MPTASELKQQGNAFFKSGTLAEAARCFTQAETTDATNAVYPSNLSAALYEMGDYAASVEAIIRAWRLLSLDDAQASGPLAPRLSARLAKALCHGARCGSITYAMVDAPATQRVIAELSCKAGGGAAWDEWNALVDGYGSNDWDEVSRQAKISLSRLPIFRSAAYSLREYCTIGQDDLMSLLDDWGLEPEYKSPVDLNKFRKSELGELSFLLAGVGDARHVYSSMIGAERAYLRLPDSKRDSFKLHFTLLDVHPAPLARDLCVMLLLDQLLNVGRDDAIEKAEILATIFYAYVAVVMPSYCEKRLLSIMKDLMAQLVSAPPQLPVWIHVNSEAIDPIMGVLRFWVGLPSSGRYTMSDVLGAHDLKTTNLEEAIKNPNMSSAYRDAIRQNLADARRATLDMLASSTAEQLAMLDLTPPPRSASAEVKRKYEERKTLLVNTTAEQSMHDVGDMGIESVWYQKTKVFMPPKTLWSRHPRFESFQQIGFGMRRISDAQFAQINSHVKKTWKPNWTLFDEVSGIYPQLQEFNPFSTPVSIREFNDRFNIKAAATGDEARPLTFYHVSDFFQAAAKALATLAGRVTLEFICGDLMQELNKMKFNDNLVRPCEFPRSFTRIYLSNIPDYTHGIINTVVFALPVVKCKAESLVTASTFANSIIWKDDAEFIYTYTLLQPNDVERFLGCRFTGRSVARNLTILGRSLQPRTLTNLASRAELEAWLIRTLIYTLAPGMNGGLMLRVRLPNNVVAFFALLVHLHSVGYPAHWLGELVQRIVSNEVTTGVTPYRGQWPIPISDARRTGPVRKIRLDPWAPEFESIFAVAGRGLPFHVRLPPDYETRSEGICTLEANMVAYSPMWTWTTPPDNITGLLFYQPRSGTSDAQEIVKDVAGILEGRCGPPPGEVYILTAVTAVALPSVRWKMGRRRFEMMREARWSVAVYRTDARELLTSPVPARKWREV